MLWITMIGPYKIRVPTRCCTFALPGMPSINCHDVNQTSRC